MSKKTIAIIEATGDMGSAIAKSLATGNYRLLLFAHETKKLHSLAEEIRMQTATADLDCMGCAADASWEADIIISTVPLNNEKEIAKKIEPFANRKIMISISSKEEDNKLDKSKAISAIKELQELLPGAKVVKLFNISFARNGIHSPAFITGNDEEALQVAMQILKIAGLNQIELISHSDRLETTI